jgi:hypothetical protein
MQTRKLIIISSIFLSACGQTVIVDNNTKPNYSDTVVQEMDFDYDEPESMIVETLYILGDINNDKKIDSAYVEVEKLIRKDSTIEKECVSKDCTVKITFTGNIPTLHIHQSLGISIQETQDLNNDNANEILLFSEWFEGYWGNIYVWSLKNGKWQEIARTKAFLAESNDYKNRIIKSNSQFYLIGDSWDDAKGGVIERSLRVEIKK